MVSFDLPGHGGSPRRASYRSDEIAAVVHEAVTGAGLDAPVVAGHSLGGVLATLYAAAYPARGVVNVDQPLLPGNFAEVLRLTGRRKCPGPRSFRGPGHRHSSVLSVSTERQC